MAHLYRQVFVHKMDRISYCRVKKEKRKLWNWNASVFNCKVVADCDPCQVLLTSYKKVYKGCVKHFNPDTETGILYETRQWRKRVFGHMQTAKAQISPRIRCSLTSLDTTECMNGEQRPGWYFAHAQEDFKPRTLRMFETTFSLDAAFIISKPCGNGYAYSTKHNYIGDIVNILYLRRWQKDIKIYFKVSIFLKNRHFFSRKV